LALSSGDPALGKPYARVYVGIALILRFRGEAKMNENETIQYEKRDRIATIRLNRPEKYNALRFEMLDQMDAALRDANRDDQARCAIRRLQPSPTGGPA